MQVGNDEIVDSGCVASVREFYKIESY